MENKINVAELLKDCPPGMELNCTMYDNVKLKYVSVYKDEDYPICIETKSGFVTKLTKYGQNVCIDDAKCVIFPKCKTTWKDFVPPCIFKDGDILYLESDNHDSTLDSWILIYKENENEEWIYKYVALKNHYTNNNNIVHHKGPICNKKDISIIRLATEAEKQKLFDAIRENGYKWNSETKTLEKLMEPNFEDGDILSSRYGNPVILKAHLPKFKVGDRIKYRHGEIIYRIVKITEDTYELDNHHSIPISLEYEYMYNLVPDKFDISTLIPYESKVLIRNTLYGHWEPAFWGAYTIDHSDGLLQHHDYLTTKGFTHYCIPYEGNEHLIGKTDDCIEYYKTWEE